MTALARICTLVFLFIFTIRRFLCLWGMCGDSSWSGVQTNLLCSSIYHWKPFIWWCFEVQTKLLCTRPDDISTREKM